MIAILKVLAALIGVIFAHRYTKKQGGYSELSAVECMGILLIYALTCAAGVEAYAELVALVGKSELPN